MTEKFEELVKSIEKNHWPVYGLEIRENGKLMHSYGDTGEGRYPIYSATKSFVSTAAGLAVEEGKFSVKESVYDYLKSEVPAYATSTQKEILKKLTIERLMTMSVKGYRPANFDSAYRGRVTLSDSLVLSLNIPFVRLVGKLGVERFADKLRELGLKHLNADDADSGLGIAIGNVEVTLVELTAAYRKLAYGGGGIFSRESSYLVSEILSGQERSSAALGHIADVVTSRFAWKTGTSSAYRDAWTIAWNPEYVIGVWCGHKRGGFGDKTLVGAKAAAPVCWKIARQLYPQNDGPWYVKPASIKKVDVCSVSGEIASQDCPRREKGDFISGASSPRPSRRFCRSDVFSCAQRQIVPGPHQHQEVSRFWLSQIP